MSKRRTHSPEFKARVQGRVAMEAICRRKTHQEIAADYAIHPSQVSQWKRQLLDKDNWLSNLTRNRCNANVYSAMSKLYTAKHQMLATM